MHTDDSFLSAIEAEPADRVRRLVYADWLDDRHDPRAELVRVEEEMRTLPVFADRFWELKPRRNELRALASGDWCARMRYGTECEPVFRHGIPDGWRDRWRLIREFTERWHRIPMPDVGGRQNEIAEAEARLKRELPPSVREWIAFAYDLSSGEGFNHILEHEYQMIELKILRAISLCRRGGAMRVPLRHTAISLSDIHQVDPPIHTFRDVGHNSNENEFRHESDRVGSESVSSYFLVDAIGGASYGAGCFWATIRNAAKLLGKLQRAFHSPRVVSNSRLYEADNIVICVLPRSEGVHLGVYVARPITRGELPAFLWRYWDMTQQRGGYYGNIERKH